MKKKRQVGFSILGLLIWAVFATGQVPSQHIEVLKAPGDPTTIYFGNVPTDVTTFDGIAVESSSSLSGPFIDMTITISKTDKSITFPAPSSPTFYRIYWWKLNGTTRTKSVSSNPVAVTIILTGIPVATGS